MQKESKKKLFPLVVKFENGATKNVKVKATDEEHAKERARKFHPNAVEVKSNA